MRTFHIFGYTRKDKVFKELYQKILAKDPLWHFVAWGNAPMRGHRLEGRHLLVRVSDKRLFAAIRLVLREWHIEWEEYDYPFPKEGKWWQLGLAKRSWEIKYQDIALLMDHLCSEAAINMSWKEWCKFITQFQHIARNTRGMDQYAEGMFLLQQSMDHLRLAGMWKDDALMAMQKKLREAENA